jgi:hypothetical protein
MFASKLSGKFSYTMFLVVKLNAYNTFGGLHAKITRSVLNILKVEPDKLYTIGFSGLHMRKVIFYV